MSIFTLLLLFSSGFIAGLIDTIAGGGGLITVPTLLSIGLPPHFALGTNKLQSSFGSGSASLNFLLAKKVNLKECFLGIFTTFTGASLGTILVQFIDSSFLGKLIPFLLIAILIYTLFTPKIGIRDIRPRIDEKIFFLIFGLLIGFYDGFFGPGTGSFWAILYVLLIGYNFSKATAYTKIMNFTSNAASLIFFIIGGKVVFHYGFIMGIGQMLGARIGAKLVIYKGIKIIKPVFILVVLAVTIKLIYQNFF